MFTLAAAFPSAVVILPLIMLVPSVANRDKDMRVKKTT
jgi:hypothetical protein